jgi:hypothetical protein
MGGKGRKVAWRARDAKLPRSLTTVYPRRCDEIPQSTPRRGKHQLRPPQMPGRERHPMAGDRSSTLRLRSGPEARMERRSARARRDDSAEHAAMVNASEGVMRRRQGEPAYAGYCPKGRGRPKREWFPAWFANGNQEALDTGPGVKHRSKAAQGGSTERSNPSVAFQHDRSREPPASADGREAWRPAIDLLAGLVFVFLRRDCLSDAQLAQHGRVYLRDLRDSGYRRWNDIKCQQQ